MLRTCATIFIALAITSSALAQVDTLGVSEPPDSISYTVLRVNRVVIVGNKVTRERIILRELSLQPGDTISARIIDDVLLRDRNKIYNLRLFNTVVVRRVPADLNMIDVLVEVTERWYIFPNPIFELSDRNFNEWWQNYDHSFKRVNYGLRLYKHNFRGQNETVRLTAQFGFSRKFVLTYRIPNIGKSQKHGLVFDFDYGEPKNVAYMTLDHVLQYQSARSTLRTTLGASVVYSFRRSFYETHSVSFEYRNTNIADTVAALNPNYFHEGAKNQMFTVASYSFNSEHRDVVAYPLKGYNFNGFISKIGLGLGDDVNMLEANVALSMHQPLGSGFYLSNFTSAFYSTPTTQPYSMYGALGYRRQFIKGYEIYVIEGPEFMLNKTTLKKKIFSRSWTIEDMPVEQFQYLPVALYLKVYYDFGYVKNYPRYEDLAINTRLSDRWLHGYGIGLDLVTLYDNVFRFEYTFTREGVNGFFFNVKKEF